MGMPGGLANELPAYKELIGQKLTSLSWEAENKLQPNSSTMTLAQMCWKRGAKDWRHTAGAVCLVTSPSSTGRLI